MESYPYAVKEG